MKRKIVSILILWLVLCSLFYVHHTKKSPWSDYASNIPVEDSVLQKLANENSQIQDFDNTGLIWKDSRGDEFPVYINRKDSCFVIRTSKNGENYKAYLGKEVSEQICRELKMKEKRNN